MGISKLDKSTGPGWEQIVTILLKYCEMHNLQPLQIKEKFGGLRFYYRDGKNEIGLGGSDAFDKLIEEAEIAAEKTCEWCGSHDGVERTKGGWIKTLCPAHREQWAAGKRWWINEDGTHA